MLELRFKLPSKELAKATAFHLEHVFWIAIAIRMLDFISICLGLLLFAKLMLLGWEWADGGRLASLLVWWIIIRRRLIRWIFSWHFHKYATDREIAVQFLPEGIEFQEEKQPKQWLPWKHLKKIWVFQNGYLFPSKGPKCFWVPLRVLEEAHRTTLHRLAETQKIPLKHRKEAL